MTHTKTDPNGKAQEKNNISTYVYMDLIGTDYQCKKNLHC